jgi:hypothetical protein
MDFALYANYLPTAKLNAIFAEKHNSYPNYGTAGRFIAAAYSV